MKSDISLVKLALCGPSDVKREIEIAQNVVTHWNLQHGEASGFWIKHQHWSTDSHPDLSERPQGVLNRQIIDEADIIVAIFWSRFGTPTGVAGSGTEEEIRRGIKLCRKVMVYFSDLEPLPPDADRLQLNRIEQFRQEFYSMGLCWRFSSRDQFRREFAGHLAFAVNELKPKNVQEGPAPSQSIKGHNNIQAGRDVNVYKKTPAIKKIIARPEGAVSTAELRQIKLWIEELAEGEIGGNRNSAYGKWGAIFLNAFKLDKREELLSSQMSDVQAWFIRHRAMQTRGQRRKAPDDFRKRRIVAIKAAMNAMRATNESYYPVLALRLKMKRPFSSLIQLTTRDLERVYRLAMRDSGRGGE